MAVTGLSIAVSLASMSQQTYAATINVTTNDPTATGGPACSLLDAFEASNSNTAYGACNAGDESPVVDVIVLANGTYDFLGSELPVSAAEETRLTGESRSGTKLQNGRLLINQYNDLEIDTISFTHFDVDIVWSGSAPDRKYNVHDVDLASSELCLRPSISSEMNPIPVEGVFKDITGVVALEGGDASTLNVLSEGETWIRNVTMNGDGADFDQPDEFGDEARAQAIWHVSNGSDKLHVDDSLFMNYPTVLKNDECFVVHEGPAWSVYLTNVMVKDISGTAIRNECGHVVINRSTFANVNGPLIRGEVSYEAYNDGFTDIEIYSSTFDGIQGDTECPSIICFQEVNSGENPKGLNRVRIKQSTFSENNAASLFASDNILVVNFGILAEGDAILEEMTLQNNAFGTNINPIFLAANQMNISGNLTTGAATAGIAHVSTLGLGLLQDNGGTSAVGENGSGGNTMTMLPLVNSPLINGANDGAGIEADQREVARNLMNRFDVGALEVTVAEYRAMGGTPPEELNVVPRAPASGQSASVDNMLILSMLTAVITLISGVLGVRYVAKRIS